MQDLLREPEIRYEKLSMWYAAIDFLLILSRRVAQPMTS